MLNFIVNPKSGKGRGFYNLKKIMNYCYKNKVEYTVHITSAQGHAIRIAKALCEQGSSTIVAVGGDGTFHEVINGAAGYKDTAVGFIPSGRGNDYARAAKLNLKPLLALKDIIRGEIVYTDIFSVREKYCLNVAGTGLDVEVLQKMEGQTGKITYLLSLINCIKTFQPYKLKTTHNGEVKVYDDIVMIGICNGTCVGGGMKLSPHSKVDDGKLNAVIVKRPEDGKLMKALAGFLKGKHITKPYVEYFECDDILIESDDNIAIQIDGEIYENIPLDCKLIKGGLKTFKTSGK